MASDSNEQSQCTAHYVTAGGHRLSCILGAVEHTHHVSQFYDTGEGMTLRVWRTRRQDIDLRPRITRRWLQRGALRWLLLTHAAVAPYAATATWGTTVDALHYWYSEQRKGNAQ